ncbi:MAG: hypothetical protein KDA92_13465 [Planctomycetales bacterium]|nr:hypothetical protein [Planctomycetales bacterium]
MFGADSLLSQLSASGRWPTIPHRRCLRFRAAALLFRTAESSGLQLGGVSSSGTMNLDLDLDLDLDLEV